MIDDPELEGKLNRRAELKPFVDEFKTLDEDVKEAVKGKEKISVGQWLITGKWINRAGYEVKAGKYWSPKFQKI